MSFCTNCGATLGVGRFCTNCGTAVSSLSGQGSDHDENPAERTNPRLPTVQPDAAMGARFPLFADEHATHSQATVQSSPPPAPTMAPISPPPLTPDWMTHRSPAPAGGSHRPSDENLSAEKRRRRSAAVWAVPLVLILVGLTVFGVWLGTRGDGEPSISTGPANSVDASSPADGQASGDPTPSVPTDDGEPPVDLSKQVKATGPKPIKPGVDLNNDPVTYQIENVLDGDPSTAYRLDGDASGTSITLTLPSGTTVAEVGLINGYAKTDTAGDRSVDWYERNRRILEVEWAFDDGTTVVQQLDATKELQILAVNNVDSAKVVMRILKVSAKPTGNLSKDVTAISEVVVHGRTS